MKNEESFDVRLQMAEMHEEFIDRMSKSYDSKLYVETVWYCYAIFEQRINRLIVKYLDKCMIPPRSDEKSAAISTRISCLEKLVDSRYGAFDTFNKDLLKRIMKWCDERNSLVHSLISIKHYRQYDDEFENLAGKGVPLVFELYDECTTFRNRWREMDEPDGEFPVKKCRCKKMQCFNSKCI
jgi:hypothetical protein